MSCYRCGCVAISGLKVSLCPECFADLKDETLVIGLEERALTYDEIKLLVPSVYNAYARGAFAGGTFHLTDFGHVAFISELGSPLVLLNERTLVWDDYLKWLSCD